MQTNSNAQKKSYLPGIISGLALALLCLWGGISSTHTLLDLVQKGTTTEGTVIKVYKGGRGSSRAVLQFTTEDHRVITTKDVFQMFFIRSRKGDTVSVIYDPREPSRATIDLGAWSWQQPVLFLLGFSLLTSVILFFMYQKK